MVYATTLSPMSYEPSRLAIRTLALWRALTCMAATVWKGHLAFGLVSIPVRLIRQRVRNVCHCGKPYRPRASSASNLESSIPDAPKSFPSRLEHSGAESRESLYPPTQEMPPIVIPVKRVCQSASGEDEAPPIQDTGLVKGFESAKGQCVVLEEEELRQIMPKTPTEMVWPLQKKWNLLRRSFKL